MKLFPVFVCVLMCIQLVSGGSPPISPTDIVAAQSQDKRDPLSFYQGTWRVTGAATQVGGLIEYRFSGNKLTITHHTPAREKDGTRIPPGVWEMDFRVAVSERGNYLKLTPIPERDPKQEMIYRVTYEDGNLQLYERDSKFWTWMLRRVKEKK